MTTKLSQRQTDIRNWLATILPQHKEALLGSDDFATVFKTGVILCEYDFFFFLIEFFDI